MESFIQDAGPGLATLVTFFAVVFLVFSVYLMVLARTDVVARRLRRLTEGPPPHEPGAVEEEAGFTVRWLAPAGRLLMPKEDWRRSHLQRLLVSAGHRREHATAVLLGSKVIAALLIPLTLFLLLLVTRGPGGLASVGVFLMLGLVAGIGYFLPDILLTWQIRERQLAFLEGFPDAMDMLVVCVEAGLGLDAAIERVAKEIALGHPDLAEEFHLLSLEMRAGKSRDEAFRSLAQRIGLDEITALVTLLIQTERFGTSIADALRSFSREMRAERIQRAKEKAAKLPVKLIFPVVFFIFPALFLVVLGPAAIRIFQVILQGSAG